MSDLLILELERLLRDYRAENGRLRDALQNAQEVLELCDQGRAGKITTPEDPIIQSLCEKNGYGAVMDSAQRSWELKDPIGCFTCGPCLSTVRTTMAQIKEALK